LTVNRAELNYGKNQGLSESRGGSGSQLEFQRRFHEPCDSRSESCKIADIPGQQNICSRFQGAMSNQRIISGCTDDGPRGSLLQSGNIFLFTERNQGELFADLLYDAYALRPSDAGTKWQASEGSVDLAECAERAEIVFPCLKEQFCAGCVLRMVSVKNRNQNRAVEETVQECLPRICCALSSRAWWIASSTTRNGSGLPVR